MICLDTNYLIRGLVLDSQESRALIAWGEAGEQMIAPSTAWFEFLCGPVAGEQIATMRAFLAEIAPFAQPQAEEAARLFNAVGRKRALRIDAMIAAAAVVAGARLATGNREDFEPFIAHGLKLT